MMINSESPEGTTNGAISYHYDITDDVLYLRLIADRDTPALGEESDEGLVELRAEQSGKLVGVTIVNWWKRFGKASLPDSISGIERHLEPWAGRL